jgi:hypothetical protein
LYAYYDDVSVGDNYTSLTGILRYNYEAFKLCPRSAADIEP